MDLKNNLLFDATKGQNKSLFPPSSEQLIEGKKLKEISWLILKQTTYRTVNYFPNKQR